MAAPFPHDISTSNDGLSSPSTAPAAAPGQPQHKRVYQACIPCRRRKVKCDLGSVDNPQDPPCVRCRRESKECFFSATRRKRKAEDDGQEESLDGDQFSDDYIKRNARKMPHVSPPASTRQESMGAPASARSAAPYADPAVHPGPPLTPGGSIGRAQPLRRPQHSADDEGHPDDSNTYYENNEAREVLRKHVYGPHDAMSLLLDAATTSPDHAPIPNSATLLPMIGNPQFQMRRPSTPSQSQDHDSMRPPHRRDPAIDPALTSEPRNGVTEAQEQEDREQSPGYKAAIKAWSRFRFVRAGWFTPAEAIEYIDYYYTYLSPLTPISPPTFKDPSTHVTLLTEEPILTVTLLTISTRYLRLKSPGGHCRSHAIHEQLWTYLRGMIERCLWGQEAFGGGFCGSGADDSSTAPWRGLRVGSLRTLGTIESLMILTEWHPRALHFPPQDATDELMLPDYENQGDNFSTDDDGSRRIRGGIGGKRIEGWLEPAWRSDRMCWMLLSTAMGLSYELGVFDNIEELVAEGGEVTRPEYKEQGYRLRAARIKSLVLIYVTQLAGRLGWTNMVPEKLQVSDPSFAPRRRKASMDGKTPDTVGSMTNSLNYIPDVELDDQIIHCWAGITNAMRIGNEKLFKSRQHTTKIIQDNSYVGLLESFQPMLKNWKMEFDRFKLPKYIEHILTIEYEYVRIYVNSLSLQAVVERCTTTANNSTGTDAVALSPQTQNYFGSLPLANLGGYSAADRGYIREVVEGSRNLLRIVVEGLLPGDYLKHAPVRTYFRIISGAMFLLKTFALGASKADVNISIDLMDAAVDALRKCIVDDVHLGIRFADLLESLTRRLRNRFMSVPAARQADQNNKRVTSPLQNQGRNPKRANIDQRDAIQDWNAGTPNYNINGQVDSISATPFDVNAGSLYSSNQYGTAPGSANYGNDMTEQLFGADWNGGSEMWYLPAGPGFFQNVGDQAITQTADGVMVGDLDLLDYMAQDPYIEGAPY